MQPRELTPLELVPPLNVTLISNDEQFFKIDEFFNRHKESGVIGWDIETTFHKDFYNRKTRTCQFGNGKEQIVIDLLALCDNDAELLEKCQGNYGKNLHLAPKLKKFLDQVKPVLCTGDWLKVGVNLGFEYMTFYWNFGMRTWKFWDCTMVEKAIYAGAHSLKDFAFYSMEEMVARYLGKTVDKELQTSFTIDAELTIAQINYAALDTRLPMTIRSIQQLILNGRTAKNNTNPANAQYLNYIDPLVTGDDLNLASRIENECIGAFQDMHVHGDRIDIVKWKARTNAKKVLFKVNIGELDKIFIPIVGSKYDIVTEEQIEAAKADWKEHAVETWQEKELGKVTAEELETKKKLNAYTKGGQFDGITEMTTKLECLRTARLIKKQLLADKRMIIKEGLKKIASDLGKKRTRINKLAAQCEGDALIHYKSNAQLLKIVQEMKGLKAVKNLDDEVLSKYEKKHPVMKLIHDYHTLSKEIGTYGDTWTSEWTTHPCKEEGYLNPGDGKLHCVYNQFHAETGRSSSEKPNGQNLPTDFDIRSCFIADPPDESIRISRCCQSVCDRKFNSGMGGYVCSNCKKLFYTIEETDPEEFVLVTADMSGAELRIIAELSGDPIWIGAFNRGEDVHSVGTEILYAELWPTLTEDGCAYFKINPATGEPGRQKCKCSGHKKLRDATKAVNFLLAYGGGPTTLAAAIGKSIDEARALMQLHEQMFPKVWAYLTASGNSAKMSKKSFDLFGGRRLFPSPDWEKAKIHAKEKQEEKLRLPDELCEQNIAKFIVKHGTKPKGDELYDLTHRQPTSKEIGKSFQALHGNIERQGKNHAIQGSNARIAKIAMGCGFDPDGKPYLWHTLGDLGGRLIKFVHDELVVQCPKRHGEAVAALIGDAFKRAAAEKMKSVVMEFDYHINTFWEK